MHRAALQQNVIEVSLIKHYQARYMNETNCFPVCLLVAKTKTEMWLLYSVNHINDDRLRRRKFIFLIDDSTPCPRQNLLRELLQCWLVLELLGQG